mgnify:CR=1 FL=1
MNTRKIIFIIGIAVVVVGSIYFMSNSSSYSSGVQTDGKNVPSVATSTGTVPGLTSKSFLMSEISAHNSKASCFTVVGQNAYDVTAWVNEHPGGEQAILGMCGKDATAEFTKQHGSSKKAQDALKTFLIGQVAAK